MKKTRKRANLRGLVSGRLVVVGTAPRTSGNNRYWRCVCTCGNRVEVRDSCLTTQKTKSCGCIVKELLSARSWKHGMGRTLDAAAWRAMIARCHNPKSRTYARYGARGISVCQRWRDSFETFLADMGPRPRGYDIDRIDNDGDYCPENCRWATRKENQRNRSNNIRVSLNGEEKLLIEWAEITGISYGTLWSRLNNGWSHERALTEGAR